MYNLTPYGNDASFVTPVTIKKGTQMAVGKAKGGTGDQIFIPSATQGTKLTYWSKKITILPIQ
jgi:hypothetical protein